MATVTFCTCTGTTVSGTGTTTGLTTIGMPTIPRSSSQLSHFSLNYLLREFCFANCPFQPPSIFPITSNRLDKAIYFLVSNDLVSHKTIKSIFTVSIFLIAIETKERFLPFGKKLAIEIDSIISTNKLSILLPKECLCNLGKI